MKKGYVIVDANDELVTEEPFQSQRKAYEAKAVYEDHCTDIALPLRVVRVETVKKEAA